ncbi:MAG: hypothetical protein J2P13_07555, partial [Acidobacteria bacterium]|nr:hypothetical protein [Acidobacteriota bacterium]
MDSLKRSLTGHASNPGRRTGRRECRAGRGNSRSHRAGERGQAAVFLVLVFGIFLIAGAGFVVDGANLWFHRQTAQTAADAACAAGAMDLLSSAGGVTPPAPWIPASDDGSGFECSGAPGGPAPCSYANLNGYPGTGSTTVEVSFPELAIARACPPAPPFFATVCAADDAATPYMRVDVQDSVPTTFMRILGAQPASAVPAKAVCGLTNVLSPLPIVVLNPNAAGGGASNTFTTSTGVLTILGGAEKSIQVNAISPDDSSNLGLGTGPINLSAANAGNGGEIAVAKHESPPLGAAIAGKWVERAGIISDPFATISAPDPGSLPPEGMVVQPSCASGPAGVPCDHYSPGLYPSIPCAGTASGFASICVNGAPGSTGLAVFDPGIYYLEGDFFA